MLADREKDCYGNSNVLLEKPDLDALHFVCCTADIVISFRAGTTASTKPTFPRRSYASREAWI
jgi:hypothetical protein